MIKKLDDLLNKIFPNKEFNVAVSPPPRTELVRALYPDGGVYLKSSESKTTIPQSLVVFLPNIGV